MNLSELIAHQPDEDTLRLWLKKIPYAAYLGIDAEVRGNEILFILPADDKLIGNPTLPAIHGGVVGAFMEHAATFHLVAKMDTPVLPKIIDFSLDYLRPARLLATYASCKVAWQEQSDQPNAIARAHFLIPEND